MAHILSGCKTALTQGRYRWRHDKMLAVLADILEPEGRKKQPAKRRPLLSTIAFMKEGQRNGGRPGEETPLPRGGTVYNSKTRHNHVISRGEEDHPCAVYGIFGGGLRRSCREEENQVPGTCPGLSGQGVGDMTDDSGSGMSRIPSSVRVETFDKGWTEKPL